MKWCVYYNTDEINDKLRLRKNHLKLPVEQAPVVRLIYCHIPRVHVEVYRILFRTYTDSIITRANSNKDSIAMPINIALLLLLSAECSAVLLTYIQTREICDFLIGGSGANTRLQGKIGNA